MIRTNLVHTKPLTQLDLQAVHLAIKALDEFKCNPEYVHVEDTFRARRMQKAATDGLQALLARHP